MYNLKMKRNKMWSHVFLNNSEFDLSVLITKYFGSRLHFWSSETNIKIRSKQTTLPFNCLIYSCMYYFFSSKSVLIWQQYSKNKTVDLLDIFVKNIYFFNYAFFSGFWKQLICLIFFVKNMHVSGFFEIFCNNIKVFNVAFDKLYEM